MLISITGLEGAPASARFFDIGAVIHHRKYDYRGVIVSIDLYCLAGETWYQSNKTQPTRNQPWYHVLVHNSGGLSTYVAQSSLEADKTGQPVVHPRLTTYFSGFKNGHYILNSDTQLGGSCSI
ncbi:MAG: heat shock protein HspQ [Verrucomicrobiota bacterium]